MAVKLGEREMLDRLRKRFHADGGNGPAYAFIEQVRNDAGFNANRTLDAMAMGLWPSRGLYLYGFEVKCSRKDWLSEMRNPAKAEAFIPFLDFFYLAVSDPEIVKAGELPETWGLLVPRSGGLAVEKEAPKLDPMLIDRGMLAALLRQAGVMAASAPDIEEARRRGYQAGKDAEATDRRWKREHADRDLERLKEREREIRAAFGDDARLVRSFDWGRPGFIAALRTALSGQSDFLHLQQRIGGLAREAEQLAAQGKSLLEKYTDPPEQT